MAQCFTDDLEDLGVKKARWCPLNYTTQVNVFTSNKESGVFNKNRNGSWVFCD